MSKVVDARNLPCPQPVLLTTEALKAASEVVTIVDNEAARQSVAKLAESQGCRVTVEQREDGIYLKLTRPAAPVAKEEPASSSVGIVLFIAADVLGWGENTELGSLLMHSFLNTLGGPYLKAGEHYLYEQWGQAGSRGFAGAG